MTEEKNSIQAYCVRCKAKTEMIDGTENTTSRGCLMLKGKCKGCGTKMCKMLGKKKAVLSASSLYQLNKGVSG